MLGMVWFNIVYGVVQYICGMVWGDLECDGGSMHEFNVVLNKLYRWILCGGTVHAQDDVQHRGHLIQCGEQSMHKMMYIIVYHSLKANKV